MKKLLCSVIIMLCLSLCFASGFSSRNKAMGYSGVNISSRQNNAFYNPASVYFYGSQNKFLIDFDFNDYILKDSFMSLENPSIGLRGRFIANYIDLGFDLSFNAQKQSDGLYTFNKNYQVNLDAAAGLRRFGLGIGVDLFSSRSRSDVSVIPSRVLIDIFEKGLMNEISRENSYFGARITAGCGYYNNGWSLAMLMDNFFDTENTGTRITWKNVLDSIAFGIGYNAEPYSNRARLNKWVFGFEAEIWNSFSGHPEFHGGAELTLQLVRNKSISIRGGAKLPLFAAEEGISTYGIGIRMNEVDLNIQTSLPFTLYTGLSTDSSELTVDLTILL